MDTAMARSEALLAAVGARRVPSGADPFDTALFDFVCDLDQLVGVAEIDSRPIPVAALQSRPRPVRRPSRWVLLPAMSGGIAAFVVLLALLLTGSATTSGAPALTATAESKQLLTHAGLLLTAAQSAAGDARTRLVTEAKADLKHVRRLLPLAPPPAQPAIRTQLQQLTERVAPMAPPPHHSTAAVSRGEPAAGPGSPAAEGPVTAPASNGQGPDGPTRQRPPRRFETRTLDPQGRSQPMTAPQQTAPPTQPGSGGTGVAPQQTPVPSGQHPPSDAVAPRSPRP
jgi:hypothetical protein